MHLSICFSRHRDLQVFSVAVVIEVKVAGINFCIMATPRAWWDWTVTLTGHCSRMTVALGNSQRVMAPRPSCARQWCSRRTLSWKESPWPRQSRTRHLVRPSKVSPVALHLSLEWLWRQVFWPRNTLYCFFMVYPWLFFVFVVNEVGGTVGWDWTN